MRKLKLIHNGEVSHLFFHRFQPDFNEAADGRGPARGIELQVAPIIDLLHCSRRPPLADLDALSGSRASAGFWSQLF
jgi:hypothetical protein